MKRVFWRCLCVCACFVLLLTACGQQPASSSDPYAVFYEPESESAAPESESRTDGGDAGEDMSESKSGSESDADSVSAPPVRPTAALSMTVIEPDGAMEQDRVVLLRVPDTWTFDGYITFMRGEEKIAEAPCLWRAGTGDSSFTDAMTDPYTSEDELSLGSEFLSSEDIESAGRALRVLHLRVWMDDSDEPIYLHCAFLVLEDCVLETHLYTAEEWGGADSAAFLEMLDSAALYEEPA